MLALVWLVARQLPAARWPLLLGAAVVLVLPYGYENTNDPLQFYIYAMILMTLGAAWLFAAGCFWRGCAVATVGMFTAASGFIAAPAYAAFIVLGCIMWRAWPSRRAVWQLTVIGTVTLLGLLNKTHMACNDALVSHDLLTFCDRLCRCVSWPSWYNPMMVVVNVAPVALLLWTRWRGDWTQLERFTLIAWTALCAQSVAIAWQRAGPDPGMVSRYQDSLSSFLLVNCLALCLLWHRRVQVQAVAGAFAVAAFTGAVAITVFSFQTGISWHRWHNDMMDKVTLLGMRHPDPAVFANVLAHLPGPKGWWPFDSPDNGPQPQTENELFTMWKSDLIKGMIPAASDIELNRALDAALVQPPKQ